MTDSGFEIVLSDITMNVTTHVISDNEIYRITFSDSRPALVITEVIGKKLFWTSVPQGRQVEAEFFGARIAEYLKNK